MTASESDETAIGEVLDRAYDLISFAAGGKPRWTEFRALFTDPCVLALRVFPDDPQVTVMDLNGYVRAQMREGLSEEGYGETPEKRTTAIVGDVATVTQRFTMEFANGESVPAIDVFALARVDSDWRIVSIVSDMER